MKTATKIVKLLILTVLGITLASILTGSSNPNIRPKLPMIGSDVYLEESTTYVHIPIVGVFDEEMLAQVKPMIEEAIKNNKGLVLDIRSPGGRTDILGEIIALISQSGQPIIAIVHGYAFSAAAVLTLYADQTVMPNRSQILFHAPRIMDSKGRVERILTIYNTEGEEHAYARGMAQAQQGARCFLSDEQMTSFLSGSDEIYVTLSDKVIEMNTCKGRVLPGKLLKLANEGLDLVNKLDKN